MDWSILATVNASLNALSFVLLMIGIITIKRGDKKTHELAMKAAGISSLIFLMSYVTYHIMVKQVVMFQGQGVVRPIYFAILISHVILAMVIAVLVPITFWRAHKEQWEAHKKIAKITFPLWLYVSLTGVVIYFMVYVIYK